MTSPFLSHLRAEISALKDAGLYKSERVISSKQAGEIAISTGERVLNFCANNYLGLADNEELAEAGKQALDRYGYGMYLREMGSVELLSREGEIAIAKRIEAGREAMLSPLQDLPVKT